MTHPTTQLRQLTMTVPGCARCGEDHLSSIIFLAFARPVVERDGTVWHYWGQCPKTLAPILVRVVEGHETFLLREGEE